jgi:hypothetical protein
LAGLAPLADFLAGLAASTGAATATGAASTGAALLDDDFLDFFSGTASTGAATATGAASTTALVLLVFLAGAASTGAATGAGAASTGAAALVFLSSDLAPLVDLTFADSDILLYYTYIIIFLKRNTPNIYLRNFSDTYFFLFL